MTNITQTPNVYYVWNNKIHYSSVQTITENSYVVKKDNEHIVLPKEKVFNTKEKIIEYLKNNIIQTC
jgi:hypothetical protein